MYFHKNQPIFDSIINIFDINQLKIDLIIKNWFIVSQKLGDLI